MSDNKHKHLEFIQTNILRMSNNSFIIKGWAITIFSALIAFSNNEGRIQFAQISFFSTLLFWYLNGFFLMNERRFRELYNRVRIKNENEIDYDLNIKEIKYEKCSLQSALISRSIWPIYFLMILVSSLFSLN